MRSLFLLLSLALLPGSLAQAGIRAVWAVSDGDKVAPDDRAHPLRAANAVWDGRAVRLLGARNEIVAFQVIVEADERGLEAARVSLPELRQGTSRIVYSPPAGDPSLYAGRPILLFSVRSMKVTQESHADWVWKPGSPAAPKRTVGWQPVQLVPENARAGRGGFPLAVGPSEVQAFWIEVDTGRGRPAGAYEGRVTVSADGETRVVPVTLRLLDFELPDANSVDAMVYYEPDQPELYQGRNLDPAYHRFAHRHRVELVHAYDEEKVGAHRGRFTGSDFTPAEGYEGPGQGVGNRIAPLSFYGPGRAFREKETAWARADAWMRFVDASLPGARTFLYLPDEPYPKQYAEVKAYAERVRSNPGPGKKLPLFLTKRIIPDFQGLVDIWSIPPQALDLKAVADERAHGRHVSFYNHGRPQGPALLIDAPASEARVVAWAAFKHGIDLYFFWHGDHWRHNSQKQGERNQDVWGNPITFDNRGQPRKPIDDQGYINGDGVLFYPGEEKLHPEQDRGLAGPVGTVQLANLRRGLQDHQYLTLARKLGLEAEVKEALAAIVPRVFSDAGATVSFPESGEPFEAVRRKLGEAIESRAKAGAHGQSTLAESLGHPRDARLIIVHADDLGEWHAVNAAAIRAFETGLVNSGAAMPACPWFPEIVAWWREHPAVDLGLHLAITSERTAYRWGPVASRDRIPSLLDPGGYLQLVQVEAAKRADAREAEVELRAQVDRALHLGLKPTHLDSHQGVFYQRPDLFEALVRVSRDYGIPLGLARSHVEAHPFMATILGKDAPLVDRAFDIPPAVPAERWADWYEAEIRGIGAGVTEIVMHPGLADAELLAGTAERPTWGALWRQRDFDYFTSDRFRELVRKQGLVLTTWREVAAAARPATKDTR